MSKFTSVILFFFLACLTGCSGLPNTSNHWQVYQNSSEMSALEKAFWQGGQDHDNNLWFVDYGVNLYFYDRNVNKWTVEQIAGKNGLGGPRTVFVGTDGYIWVGTNQGLGRFEPHNNQWATYGTENGLTNEDIRAVFQDNNKLWVGTGGGGIFTSEDDGLTWQPVIIEEGFSALTVNQIYKDGQGYIWVASSSGLFQHQPETKAWVTFTDGSPRLNSMAGEWTTHPNENVVLISNSITGIAEDSKGILWFSTLDGASSYNSAQNQWLHFTTEDGLVNEMVWSVAVDKEDQIWFGTEAGANRFKPNTGEWAVFNKQNGFTEIIK